MNESPIQVHSKYANINHNQLINQLGVTVLFSHTLLNAKSCYLELKQPLLLLANLS